MNDLTALPEMLMIEVGRLKLRRPGGDDATMNQIQPTAISTCIEESIAENGKVILIHFSGNGWGYTFLCSLLKSV